MAGGIMFFLYFFVQSVPYFSELDKKSLIKKIQENTNTYKKYEKKIQKILLNWPTHDYVCYHLDSYIMYTGICYHLDRYNM